MMNSMTPSPQVIGGGGRGGSIPHSVQELARVKVNAGEI